MRLVIHNDRRGLGGTERQVEILARGLQARGHDVLVSCHPGGALRRHLDHLGIRTTSIQPGGRLGPLSALRFAWLLRRERPRALLLTSWRRSFWGARAARLAGVPTVVARLDTLRPALDRWMHASTLRHHVDVVMASSRDLRDAFLSAVPEFPATAVPVVRNATPVREAERTGDLRSDLGLAPDAPLAVVIAPLTAGQGHDLLLESFRTIGSGHLALVGAGGLREELEARTRLAGLERRVHFVGARADTGEVLGGADLFVLPGRAEGVPTTMLEAMAAGLPVVAVEAAGVRETLGSTGDHGPAGWVVPADDGAALARALRRALAAVQAGEAAKVGEEARRRAREWFGPQRMVDEAEAVLFGAPGSGVTP